MSVGARVFVCGFICLIEMLLVCLLENVACARVFAWVLFLSPYCFRRVAQIQVSQNTRVLMYSVYVCLAYVWVCVCVSCVCVGPTLALCCYWVLISSHPHRPLVSSFSLPYLYNICTRAHVSCLTRLMFAEIQGMQAPLATP